MAKPIGKRPENFWKTLRTLLHYMGNHRFLLLAVAVLVSLSALANLLGTYMLKPIVNDYIIPRDVNGLIHAVALTACIYGAGVLSAYGYTQIMVVVAQKIVCEIREDLFHRMQSLPLRYFDTNPNGDTMSRFTNDVDTISDALNNSFAMMVQSFIQIVGTLTLIFILNWQLSLIVLLCYVLMFAYIRFSGQRSRHYFGQQQRCLGRLNGFVEEMIQGQKVVKVFNHEQANMAEFRARNGELQQAATSALAYAGTMVPMVVSLSYVNYAIVAIVGGIMAINGWTDVGSLASYLVFVRQTAMPINQFTSQSNLILTAMSGAERIFELMEQEPERDEGRVTLTSVARRSDGSLYECVQNSGMWAWRHPRADGSVELVELRGDVRFDHVRFGYDSGRPILHDISLYAKPGQKIAFVGATGAGKTTITNLINRFYDIQKGSITYDGIDVKLIKKADLRGSLGIVLQDTHLFSGTIRDNIRYGKPEASEEEVIAAAKLANAHEFIRHLEHGYDTVLSGDGSALSQGQRQLISIARAALANAPVLILDEATSSIDSRTEKIVQDGMDKLMKGRTTFVIAHRLSTIKNSDVIMVLDQGRIIERGNHESLLAKKGIYYQLYTGALEMD